MRCELFRYGRLHLICGRSVFAAVMICVSPLSVFGQQDAEMDFGLTSASVDPLFEYENTGERGSNPATLKSAPASTVDLNVGVGMNQTLFPGAGFDFDAALTSINSGMVGETLAFELLFNGSMSFSDAGMNLILSVDFEQARMLVISDDGGQTVTFTSGIGANSMVDFSAGPSFPDGLMFVSSAPQEFSFTISDFQDPSGGPVDIDEAEPDKFLFEDFRFNSSFSASAEVIPEPASIALLVLGALLAAPASGRWRRR